MPLAVGDVQRTVGEDELLAGGEVGIVNRKQMLDRAGGLRAVKRNAVDAAVGGGIHPVRFALGGLRSTHRGVVDVTAVHRDAVRPAAGLLEDGAGLTAILIDRDDLFFHVQQCE